MANYTNDALQASAQILNSLTPSTASTASAMVPQQQLQAQPRISGARPDILAEYYAGNVDGSALTEAEKQYVANPDAFAKTYDDASSVFEGINSHRNAVSRQERAHRSAGEILQDDLVGITHGAGNMGLATLSFADPTDTTNKWSNSFDNWAEDNKSTAMATAKQVSAMRGAALDEASERQYQKDIVSGKGSVASTMSKIGRDVANTLSTLDSTQVTDMASEGVGSLAGMAAVGFVGSRALGAVAPVMLAGRIAKVAQAVGSTKAGKLLSKAIGGTSGAKAMLTNAVLEGGIVKNSAINEINDMSDAQIKQTDYYKDALANGANEDDAVSIAREQAKKDVASQGRLLGAGVGALSGRFIDEGLFKDPTKLVLNKAANSITSAIIKPNLKQTFKESVQEAVESPSEQLAQNMIMQDNIDPNVDIMRDVTKQTVQGAIGGALSVPSSKVHGLPINAAKYVFGNDENDEIDTEQNQQEAREQVNAEQQPQPQAQQEEQVNRPEPTMDNTVDSADTYVNSKEQVNPETQAQPDTVTSFVQPSVEQEEAIKTSGLSEDKVEAVKSKSKIGMLSNINAVLDNDTTLDPETKKNLGNIKNSLENEMANVSDKEIATIATADPELAKVMQDSKINAIKSKSGSASTNVANSLLDSYSDVPVVQQTAQQQPQVVQPQPQQQAVQPMAPTASSILSENIPNTTNTTNIGNTTNTTEPVTPNSPTTPPMSREQINNELRNRAVAKEGNVSTDDLTSYASYLEQLASANFISEESDFNENGEDTKKAKIDHILKTTKDILHSRRNSSQKLSDDALKQYRKIELLHNLLTQKASLSAAMTKAYKEGRISKGTLDTFQDKVNDLTNTTGSNLSTTQHMIRLINDITNGDDEAYKIHRKEYIKFIGSTQQGFLQLGEAIIKANTLNPSNAKEAISVGRYTVRNTNDSIRAAIGLNNVMGKELAYMYNTANTIDIAYRGDNAKIVSFFNINLSNFSNAVKDGRVLVKAPKRVKKYIHALLKCNIRITGGAKETIPLYDASTVNALLGVGSFAKKQIEVNHTNNTKDSLHNVIVDTNKASNAIDKIVEDVHDVERGFEIYSDEEINDIIKDGFTVDDALTSYNEEEDVWEVDNDVDVSDEDTGTGTENKEDTPITTDTATDSYAIGAEEGEVSDEEITEIISDTISKSSNTVFQFPADYKVSKDSLTVLKNRVPLAASVEQLKPHNPKTDEATNDAINRIATASHKEYDGDLVNAIDEANQKIDPIAEPLTERVNKEASREDNAVHLEPIEGNNLGTDVINSIRSKFKYKAITDGKPTYTMQDKVISINNALKGKVNLGLPDLAKRIKRQYTASIEKRLKAIYKDLDTLRISYLASKGIKVTTSFGSLPEVNDAIKAELTAYTSNVLLPSIASNSSNGILLMTAIENYNDTTEADFIKSFKLDEDTLQAMTLAVAIEVYKARNSTSQGSHLSSTLFAKAEDNSITLNKRQLADWQNTADGLSVAENVLKTFMSIANVEANNDVVETQGTGILGKCAISALQGAARRTSDSAGSKYKFSWIPCISPADGSSVILRMKFASQNDPISPTNDYLVRKVSSPTMTLTEQKTLSFLDNIIGRPDATGINIAKEGDPSPLTNAVNTILHSNMPTSTLQQKVERNRQGLAYTVSARMKTLFTKTFSKSQVEKFITGYDGEEVSLASMSDASITALEKYAKSIADTDPIDVQVKKKEALQLVEQARAIKRNWNESHANKALGKVTSVDRNFDRIQELSDAIESYAKANNVDPSQCYQYFDESITKPGRLQEVGLSPAAGKILREVLPTKSVLVDVTPSNVKATQGFKIGLAQAVGKKAHQNDATEYMALGEDVLKEVATLSDATKSAILEGIPLSDNQFNEVMQLFDKNGYDHTEVALHALHDSLVFNANNGKILGCTLTVEIDARSSGHAAAVNTFSFGPLDNNWFNTCILSGNLLDYVGNTGDSYSSGIKEIDEFISKQTNPNIIASAKQKKEQLLKRRKNDLYQETANKGSDFFRKQVLPFTTKTEYKAGFSANNKSLFEKMKNTKTYGSDLVLESVSYLFDKMTNTDLSAGVSRAMAKLVNQPAGYGSGVRAMAMVLLKELNDSTCSKFTEVLNKIDTKELSTNEILAILGNAIGATENTKDAGLDMISALRIASSVRLSVATDLTDLDESYVISVKESRINSNKDTDPFFKESSTTKDITKFMREFDLADPTKSTTIADNIQILIASPMDNGIKETISKSVQMTKQDIQSTSQCANVIYGYTHELAKRAVMVAAGTNAQLSRAIMNVIQGGQLHELLTNSGIRSGTKAEANIPLADFTKKRSASSDRSTEGIASESIKTGLRVFISSMLHKGLSAIGVAAQVERTQSGSDATIVNNAIVNNPELFNTLTVFDGIYSRLDKINEMSDAISNETEDAFKQIVYAQLLEVVDSIHALVKEDGLMPSLLSTPTDGKESFSLLAPENNIILVDAMSNLVGNVDQNFRDNTTKEEQQMLQRWSDASEEINNNNVTKETFTREDVMNTLAIVRKTYATRAADQIARASLYFGSLKTKEENGGKVVTLRQLIDNPASCFNGNGIMYRSNRNYDNFSYSKNAPVNNIGVDSKGKLLTPITFKANGSVITATTPAELKKYTNCLDSEVIFNTTADNYIAIREDINKRIQSGDVLTELTNRPTVGYKLVSKDGIGKTIASIRTRLFNQGLSGKRGNIFATACTKAALRILDKLPKNTNFKVITNIGKNAEDIKANLAKYNINADDALINKILQSNTKGVTFPDGSIILKESIADSDSYVLAHETSHAAFLNILLNAFNKKVANSDTELANRLGVASCSYFSQMINRMMSLHNEEDTGMTNVISAREKLRTALANFAGKYAVNNDNGTTTHKSSVALIRTELTNMHKQLDPKATEEVIASIVESELNLMSQVSSILAEEGMNLTDLSNFSKASPSMKTRVISEVLAYIHSDTNIAEQTNTMSTPESIKMDNAVQRVYTKWLQTVNIAGRQQLPKGANDSLYSLFMGTSLTLLEKGEYDPSAPKGTKPNFLETLDDTSVPEALRKRVKEMNRSLLRLSEVNKYNTEFTAKLDTIMKHAQAITNHFATAFNLTDTQKAVYQMMYIASSLGVNVGGTTLATDMHKTVAKALQQVGLDTFGEAENAYLYNEASPKYDAIQWVNDPEFSKDLVPAIIALSTVNKEVYDIIANTPLDKSYSYRSPTNNKLEEKAANVLDAMFTTLSRTKHLESGKELLNAYTEALADNDAKLAMINLANDTFNSVIDRAEKVTTDYVLKGLSLGAHALTKMPVISPVASIVKSYIEALRVARATGNTVGAHSMLGNLYYRALAREDKKFTSKLITFLLKEYLNITPETDAFYTAARKAKQAIDVTASGCRVDIPGIIKEELSKALGRKVTQKDLIELNNIVNHTALSSLSIMNKQNLMQLLTNPNALDTAIANAEAEISSYPANIDQRVQCIYMASHMVYGEYVDNTLAKKPSVIYRNTEALSLVSGISSAKNISVEHVNALNNLVTLYAIKFNNALNPSLASTANRLGVKAITTCMQYHASKQADDMKLLREAGQELNRYQGYVPTINYNGASTVILNDEAYEDVNNNFKKLGYVKGEKYTPSTLDKTITGSYHYYHIDINTQQTFLNGALHVNNQSAGGIDIATGFSVNNQISAISDPDSVAEITQEVMYSPTNTGMPLVPIFDSVGNIKAYEHVVSNRELLKGQSLDESFAAVVGEWSAKQIGQENFKETTNKVIEQIYELYEKDVVNRNYGNYLFYDPELNLLMTRKVNHTTGEIEYEPAVNNNNKYKKALSKINKSTRTAISDIGRTENDSFSKKYLPIRKDMVNQIFGQERGSITELWDSDNKWLNRITHVADKVNGTLLRKLLRVEHGMQSFTGLAKHNIVVKSLAVVTQNMVGNAVELSMMGVPAEDITKGIYNKTKECLEYEDILKKIEKLKLLKSSANSTEEKNALDNRIRGYESTIRNMSIYPVIELGHFSMIKSVESIKDAYSSLPENQVQERIQHYLNNLPEGARKAISQLAVSQNTALYQALLRASQYGDFVAKSIAYDYLSKKGEPTQHIQYVVNTAFVDYNFIPSKTRDTLESLGLLWFMNYKLRIAKMIPYLMVNHPVRFLFWLGVIPNVSGWMPDNPVKDSALGRILGFGPSLSGAMGLGTGFRALTANPILAFAKLFF